MIAGLYYLFERRSLGVTVVDLISALQIAMRRWKIVVSVVALTLVAAAAAFFSAGAVYSSTNYVVVVPNTVTNLPSGNGEASLAAQADQAQRSALVSAGGARLVSNLLVTNLNSAQAQTRFGAGNAAAYTVTGDNQLPVVTVNATGADAAAVRDLLGRVVDGSDAVLAELQTQAGIPPGSAYRAPRFAPDPVVNVSYPDRTKIVVAILVAGVALAILLAVALDGPLTRRRQAKGGSQLDDEGTPLPEYDGSASVDGPRHAPDSAPERPVPSGSPQGSTGSSALGPTTGSQHAAPRLGANSPSDDTQRLRAPARPSRPTR